MNRRKFIIGLGATTAAGGLAVGSGAFTSVEADRAILAMGFLGPGPDPLAEQLSLERDQRSNLVVNDNYMTSSPGIFSAGDMARGQSLVVRAMADGKAAADHIKEYIDEI